MQRKAFTLFVPLFVGNGDDMTNVWHEEKGTGRLPAFDPKNMLYRMADAPEMEAAPAAPGAKSWRVPKSLDQGSTPRCVGYSLKHLLLAAPVMTKLGPTQDDIYFGAQLLDPFPGEDYDGTTVGAGVKFLNKLGYVGEYRWGTGVDEAVAWLATISPVAFGISWTHDMFYPNEHGLITPTGANAGGHAILGFRYDPLDHAWDKGYKHIWLLNSWSGEWGIDGKCCIRTTDLDALIHDSGECLTVREMKVQKPARVGAAPGDMYAPYIQRP
jgi:hypothetical protein